MTENILTLQIFLLSLITGVLVLMSIVRKYSFLINLYVLQSLSVVALLVIDLYSHFSLGFMIIGVIMFIVKIIAVPVIFLRLIRKINLNITPPSVLSVPFTLCSLFILFVFSQSDILSPVSVLLSVAPQIKTLLICNLLISVFLIFNKRGALSQIIGILSLENTIFILSIFLQIKQMFSLELGILFSLFFWIIASSALLRMLFNKLGSFDVSILNELKK